MRTRRRYWILALLSLLLLGSVQRVLADDNQPRLMLPTADFSGDGIGGTAFITPNNPYFTVFLWRMNEDRTDTHWIDDPYLTVDGHEIHLGGFSSSSKSEWRYCDTTNGVYYYVRAGKNFRAGSNTTFQVMFPELKKKAHWDDDHYRPLNIYIVRNTAGATHRVSARGKFHSDEGAKGKDYSNRDAKSLDDRTYVESGTTVLPFALKDVVTDMKWTAPGKLTFTSQSFDDKAWGSYQVGFDGVTGNYVHSGRATVTKDYGKGADYKTTASKKVDYTYVGTYDPDKPTKRKDGPGTYSMTWGGGRNAPTYYLSSDSWFGDSYHYCNTTVQFDHLVFSTSWSAWQTQEATKFSFRCFDKNILKIELLDDSYKSFQEWNGNSPTAEMTVKAQKYVCGVKFTFDSSLDGFRLFFTGSLDKAPKSLPYPTALTPSYNAWNKTVTLKWKSENTTKTNYPGSYVVFRDGTKIGSVTAHYGTNDYQYEDNVAYSQNYRYKVTFVPEDWSDGSYDDGLSTTTDAKLERTVKLENLQAVARSDGYRVSWSIAPELDRSGYKFKVYRRTITADKPNTSAADFNGLDPIATIDVTNKGTLNYSYDDKQVTSTATYSYLVKLEDIQETTLTAGPITPTGELWASHVKKLTASKGAFSDHVHLAWDQAILGSDNLVCDIWRHKIKEGENDVYTVGEALQLDWDKIATFTSTATQPVGTYDDRSAVGGYYYVYAVVGRPNGSMDIFNRIAADGFSRSTGQLSGSVTYADGRFAVEGVKMQMATSATTNNSPLFNALALSGGKGGVHWNATYDKNKEYFAKAFSVQMYVRPDAGNSAGTCLVDMGGRLRIALGDYREGLGYALTLTADGGTFSSARRIQADRFTNIAFAYDGSSRATLYLTGPDTLKTDSLTVQDFDMGNLAMTKNDTLHVAVGADMDSTRTLRGYVDEVRFFKRQLTSADVQQNYSHYMGGTESGLVAYWPFDEGISTMRRAYDYSKTADTPNENHAVIFGGRRTSVTTPTAEQLSLYAVTDTLGAYTLRGIPFSGEGTTYSLIPTKGAHSFSPTTRTLYVSPNTLSFDPQNFTDNSSFNVKGVVYYENTTYPVKGCRFRVDDVVVKDEWGNEILSDENGEFTIPVSIGQHAIYVEKEGHTFLNNGRYPKSGLLNVNEDISRLTFTDQTKAVVVGRVAGGAIEKNKPLGMGLSKANIGAATLTLLTSTTIEDSRRMNVELDSIEGVFNSRTDTLFYQQANPDRVKSRAWVNGCTDKDPNGMKRITIQTDPNTGEFAVLLPPVPYYIETKVDNNSEATANLKAQTLLDCSNVLETKKDSALVDSVWVSTEYNSAFVKTFFSVPVLSVEQGGNTVGAFGDAIVPAGELNDSVPAYTFDPELHTLTYHYGYPIFTSCQTYEFGISSYEQYYNYDFNPERPDEDRVPSTEGYLTFKNPMVLTADTVSQARLDSLGCYVYKFQAIEPNEVEPYTQPIDIMLTIGDNNYLWNWENGDYRGNLQCVVFGAKATGNTSVTSAPDKLLNILRDPFGSKSNVVWNSGSARTYGFNVDVKTSVSVGSDYGMEGGTKVDVAEGAPGLYVYEDMHLSGGYDEELSWEPSLQYGGGVTWDISTVKSFQTSAEPFYDGPNGDLFIGMSSSLVYGDGLQVMLVNDQENGYKVGTREVIATAQSLGTTFAYAQDYIVKQLIPSYKRMREARLMKVSDEQLAEYKQSFVNTTDSIIYMTSLSVDDPKFGSNNTDADVWGKDKAVKKSLRDGSVVEGPSYTYFIPETFKNEEETWDAIESINMQIHNWEGFLSLNEEGKVKTIQRGKRKENISFDSGSGWSETYQYNYTGSEDISFTSTFKELSKTKVTGGSQNGTVIDYTGAFTVTYTNVFNPSLNFSQKSIDSYTVNLSDNVADNAHQVAMYEATDDFGYVFFQSSGQTSRNYEGEKRTEYYEPGLHVLSNATVQIETPHIDCEHPTVTGVPEGQAAAFTLKLSNPTMANVSRNIDFDLWIDNDKYAAMSKVTMNGVASNGNSYPVVLSPGGVAEVTVEVKPANSEVIHIDSLHVYFSSAGQVSISDDIYLSAHFLPTAEPVTLAASRDLVNTATDSTLVLSASGYNLNSSILNGVMLQQRRADAPEWTTIHSWVKGTPAGDTESRLDTERIDTLIDMHSSIFYPDATYQFRAVTDCTVATEQVLGLSDTITVVRDVTLPQPLYLPEPADGVLGAGDNISLTFNEDIRSQSLNKADNFIIQSILNTDSVAHEVALRLDGGNAPVATSQSQLTLGATSLTLAAWVKSGGTAGTLFRHGEGANAFRVDIDGDGYVTVYVTDGQGVAKPYRSVKALPRDIWAYFAVVYDVDYGNLSAYYASGDKEGILMEAASAGSDGRSTGYIYLGEGLTGAMHELSLFSAPLTWTTIKAQMYLGKSHSTPSLIGYWRLDEGHGDKSEDLARSRHLRLASPNSWYMENENLTMALDGTHYAGIPMGQLSTTEGVSYLVELWALMEPQSTQSGQCTQSLLSMDNGQKLDLNITADGTLELVADSTAYPSTSSAYALNDHQWHHVALNVLKGGSGLASVLVDGTVVLTVAADKVPALAGGRLWLGRGMKGMLDEVRLWHGINTQETIAERMYYRLDGSSMKGLVGYYPMEKTYYDEYDQRVFEFSLDNKGYEATAATTLVTDAEGVTLSEGSDAPGLKTAPNKTNLDFGFVADERTVSVTLDHSAESLEGCTVDVTLRDYYDMHSNVGTPMTWSFTVKQNALSWNTGEVHIRETAGESSTFTATLTNNGQGDEQWSFTELPSWLEATPSSGTIFAHGAEEVTFTVKPGNAIGKYFTTVNACGNKGLDTPLDICLTVEGQRPDWTAVETGRSMTVTGQIRIDGILSTDPEDIVAAFDDSEGLPGRCIGVGQPRYKSGKDAYYVDMTIFGSKEMEQKGQPVHFRIYDASTGKIYQLTKVSEEVKFKTDSSVGTSSDPLIWENSDKLLELADLKEGYQWISFYLKPDSTTLSVFNPVKNQISTVEVGTGEDDVFTCSNGSWSGTYDGIDAGKMMKVAMNGDATLPVVGTAVNPADYEITVKPEPAVNWIGVPTDSYMTLGEAFAALSPEEGDQVRSQTAFSTFENGAWDGLLEVIEPGKGYIYISKAETAKTFTFPSVPAYHSVQSWRSLPGIAANFKYRHNMVVICTIHDCDGQPVQAKSVEAYDAAGELRGQSSRCFRDSLYILIVSGDEAGEPVIIRPKMSGRLASESISAVLRFQHDKLIGTFKNPLVLQPETITDIENLRFGEDSQLAVYGLTGQTAYSGPANQFERRQLPTGGVYIISETTAGGQIIVRKVIFP